MNYLSRRADLLLALPVEKLEMLALELRVRAIAAQSSTQVASRRLDDVDAAPIPPSSN